MAPLNIDPAHQYSSSMDSVKLINKLLSKPALDEEEKDRVDRNVEHLEIMVAKDFWTTEDLTPFRDAIAAGKAALAA
jgi:hypothetical protein